MTISPLHAHFGFDAARLRHIVDPEDTGESTTRRQLAHLADEGLLDLGTAGADGLDTQVAVVSALAHRSLTVAFSAWAHRMVLEYVTVADPGHPLVEELRSVDVVGSTAMAAALRAHLGLGAVGLTASPETDGSYRVDGTIRWASNLTPGRTVVVAAARTPDDRHVVIALPVDGRRVTPAAAPGLLALQATSSTSVDIAGAVVPPGLVLSDDLAGFLARVRPVFLLLQAAFAIGLGEAALDAAHGPLEDDDRVLNTDIADLHRRHGALVADTERAVAGTLAGRDLISYRLAAANFATDAVATEAKRTGGRGYLAGSPTARRIREAAFLPIQSPTETQLRWELSCSA